MRVISPDSVIVKLSPGDLRSARALANQRNNKGSATSKKYLTGTTDFQIHYVGALAEIAWSKHTGWKVDKVEKAGGDGGSDFVANGRIYQVKARDCSRFCNPDILVEVDMIEADRYILAEVAIHKEDEVVFVGWCSRDELIQRTIDVGYGPRYIRSRTLLHTIPQTFL